MFDNFVCVRYNYTIMNVHLSVIGTKFVPLLWLRSYGQFVLVILGRTDGSGVRLGGPH